MTAEPRGNGGTAGRGGLSIVSLVLASVGLLFSIVPVASFVAWIPAAAAVVVALVAIARRTGRRALAIVGLVVGSLALVLALVVSSVTARVVFDLIETAQSNGAADPTNEPDTKIEPAPADEGPALVPEASVIAGSGPSRIAATPLEGAREYGIARVTISGDGSSTLTALDASGAEVEKLLDTTGNYHGDLIYNTVADAESVVLAIDTAGEWTIELLSIYIPASVGAGRSHLGSGDTVLFIEADEAVDGVLETLFGASGSIVPIGSSGGCSAAVESTCSFQVAGMAFVQIKSDGNWRLTLAD